MPVTRIEVMDALQRKPELLRRARFVHLDFAIAAGSERHLVSITPGSVAVGPAAADAKPAFTIAASPEAWAEFARPEPRPGFHDVIAMAESGHGEIQGDDLLPFFGNLLLVKGVVAAFFKGDASW